jgi:hypothetical protein
MPSTRYTAIILLALPLITVSNVAFAVTSKHPQQQQRWTAGDKCNRQAIEKFPDYTVEENAKREAYLRRCNNSNDAPGRSPLSGGTSK